MTASVGLTTYASAQSNSVGLAGGSTSALRCDYADLEQCHKAAAGGPGVLRKEPCAYVRDTYAKQRSAGKNDMAAAPAQKDDAMAPVTRLPWPAPIGHRQPRASEIPKNPQLSEFEPEQRWLDKDLDRKLKICRGC